MVAQPFSSVFNRGFQYNACAIVFRWVVKSVLRIQRRLTNAVAFARYCSKTEPVRAITDTVISNNTDRNVERLFTIISYLNQVSRTIFKALFSEIIRAWL